MASKLASRVATIGTALTLSVAGVAYAGDYQGPAGGGTWDTGSRVVNGVWSYYQHNSKTHRSSVINGCGTYNGSAWLPARTQARANANYCVKGTNQGYWDTK